MSDAVKHECAVALLRLRKPPEYYFSKYGSADYGFSKMALLSQRRSVGTSSSCLHPSMSCFS